MSILDEKSLYVQNIPEQESGLGSLPQRHESNVERKC